MKFKETNTRNIVLVPVLILIYFFCCCMSIVVKRRLKQQQKTIHLNLSKMRKKCIFEETENCSFVAEIKIKIIYILLY